jgi:DNA-binding LacI/PurR family transcriptional regulator
MSDSSDERSNPRVPTIFEVAERAGVSITTVSRALNGYSDVNEKTRQRVVEAADELNYYPNATARSLRGQRTNTIVFAPQFHAHVESQPFFKEFIGTLAMACFKHDLSLLVSVADSSAETNDLYRELAGSRRADGIILADIRPHDARIALLQEIGIPFIAFGRSIDYSDLSYPLVDVDGAAGVRAVVAHLHARGHRRIAYLSGPFNTSYALDRYSGYREALVAHDLPATTDLLVRDLRERAETAVAVDGLLRLPPEARPTAFVCSSDRLALDVISTLRARGLPVGAAPGALAVTGFDDLPFAAYLHPALTTIRQPLDLACATLLDLLIVVMRHKDDAVLPASPPGVVLIGPRQVLLEPELIIRDSG